MPINYNKIIKIEPINHTVILLIRRWHHFNMTYDSRLIIVYLGSFFGAFGCRCVRMSQWNKKVDKVQICIFLVQKSTVEEIFSTETDFLLLKSSNLVIFSTKNMLLSRLNRKFFPNLVQKHFVFHCVNRSTWSTLNFWHYWTIRKGHCTKNTYTISIFIKN